MTKRAYRGSYQYEPPFIEVLMQRLSVTLKDAVSKTDSIAVAAAFARCRTCENARACETLMSDPDQKAVPEFCGNRNFFGKVAKR